MANAFSVGFHLCTHFIGFLYSPSLSLTRNGTCYSPFRGAAGSVVSWFDSLVVALVAPVTAGVASTFGIAWGIVVSALLYCIMTGLVFYPSAVIHFKIEFIGIDKMVKLYSHD